MSDKLTYLLSRRITNKSIWIVVAHDAGARIYKTVGKSGTLRIVRRISNPSGRYKGRQINADRPGRVFSNSGVFHHALSRRIGPHDHNADVFAREIAAFVEKGRNTESFNHLVLIAEPKFLGKIRIALKGATAKRIIKVIKNDFAYVPDTQLPNKIKESLRENGLLMAA